jgi:hypothetical protein
LLKWSIKAKLSRKPFGIADIITSIKPCAVFAILRRNLHRTFDYENLFVHLPFPREHTLVPLKEERSGREAAAGCSLV